MRAASALRSSGSRVRGIADKHNKWRDVARAPSPAQNIDETLTYSRGRLSLRRSDAAALLQLHYLVEHAVSHFPFRGFGNLDHFALRDDRNRVTVGIKTNALA